MVRSGSGYHPQHPGHALILIQLVFLFAAVLVAGILLPGRVIGSGLDQYEGQSRAFAEGTLSEMESTDLKDSTDAFIATAHRVVGVERCSPPPVRAFRMEIRLYTIFGIPYGTKQSSCFDPVSG